MAIYHWVEGLAWPDAFLNAAMLLGGMGPVDPLHTTAGKWLAGLYALLAGVVFLVRAGRRDAGAGRSSRAPAFPPRSRRKKPSETDVR